MEEDRYFIGLLKASISRGFHIKYVTALVQSILRKNISINRKFAIHAPQNL